MTTPQLSPRLTFGYPDRGCRFGGTRLAARLSEGRGRTVLLLEVGPDYPTETELLAEVRIGSRGWAIGSGKPPEMLAQVRRNHRIGSEAPRTWCCHPPVILRLLT